ncbi:hypothetical protein [Deinococcus hopiensis]|nr:hypothetical protein [Deinococcus hopiensis]
MKRLWFALFAASLLGACGTVATPASSTPRTAGELLGAPTSLQVSGRSVRADAAPVLAGDTFRVRVKVQASRAPLPPLTVTGVYVVTEDGVWRAGRTRSGEAGCAAQSCVQGTGEGAASGLRAGDGVQVVVSLKDAGGRTMWLRDPQASIK